MDVHSNKTIEPKVDEIKSTEKTELLKDAKIYKKAVYQKINSEGKWKK